MRQKTKIGHGKSSSMIILVLCGETFVSFNISETSRDTQSQRLAAGGGNASVPSTDDGCYQFLAVCWSFLLNNGPDICPQILNGVDIGALTRPVSDVRDIMLVKISQYALCSMTRCVVVLKHCLGVGIQFIHCHAKLSLKNLFIHCLIHFLTSLENPEASDTIIRKRAPYHDTRRVFDRWKNALMRVSLTLASPNLDAAAISVDVERAFIGKDHSFPIIFILREILLGEKNKSSLIGINKCLSSCASSLQSGLIKATLNGPYADIRHNITEHSANSSSAWKPVLHALTNNETISCWRSLFRGTIPLLWRTVTLRISLPSLLEVTNRWLGDTCLVGNSSDGISFIQ